MNMDMIISLVLCNTRICKLSVFSHTFQLGNFIIKLKRDVLFYMYKLIYSTIPRQF